MKNIHRHRFVLAIDPGTRMTGVALFDGKKLHEAFTVKGPIKLKDTDIRAYHIIREIEDRLSKFIVCDRCDQSHVTLVYEDPQYQQRKGGGHFIEPVYRMAGMLTYWGTYTGMQVFRYKVGDIKYALTKTRNAKKDVVEARVRKLLRLKTVDYSDHAFDAISVGMYHLDQRDPGCFGQPLC